MPPSYRRAAGSPVPVAVRDALVREPVKVPIESRRPSAVAEHGGSAETGISGGSLPMSSRSRRRATAAAVAALTLALSAPLAAHAGTADAPALPELEQQSAESGTPREGTSPGFRSLPSAPQAASQKSSASALAAAAPAQVSGVVVVDVRSTAVDLVWSAPSDGGSPITGYHLQLLQSGSVVYETDWDPSELGTNIFGLDPDTTYEFQVAAMNSMGTGAYSTPVQFVTTHSSVERIYGADRYETAAGVSYDAFPFADAYAAFVANGRNFPDALSAAAAAGAFGGPVLLTPATTLAPSTAAEVSALTPDYVVVAGGSAVVSDAVLNQLSAYATVESFRVGGSNRYDTAAQMSGLWGSPQSTIYLASGTNYPDALAGAAAAGYNGVPVLLATRDVLPADTIAALQYHQPANIIALGGAGAISDSVLKQARLATGVTTTTSRLWGSTRYDTAVEISEATFTTPRVPVVYVASGRNFADALAGAAAGGTLGGPVLLTPPTGMPAAVLAEIERLDPVRVIVLGGPAVVSEQVSAQIAGALG